jgi:hypothetical protein
VPRGQRDGSLRPYSRFSRQEPLLFYQVAPQLYSRGRVDPVPDPLLFANTMSFGNTRIYQFTRWNFFLENFTSFLNASYASEIKMKIVYIYIVTINHRIVLIHRCPLRLCLRTPRCNFSLTLNPRN